MLKADLPGVEQKDLSLSSSEDIMFKSGVPTVKLAKAGRAQKSKKINVNPL
jgi:HSP20 family molecular chaperone IbpA